MLRKDADSRTAHSTEIVSSTTQSLNCRHRLVEEYGELGTDNGNKTGSANSSRYSVDILTYPVFESTKPNL